MKVKKSKASWRKLITLPRISKAEKERLEFARTHHSQERVQWVQSRPCVACGAVGFTENAHVGNEGAGTSRKANYDQITELCGPRAFIGAAELEGCHRMSHRIGQDSFEKLMRVDLAACMRETERAWQERCAMLEAK